MCIRDRIKCQKQIGTLFILIQGMRKMCIRDRNIKKTKVTIKKLDKKETYWVKARAYKVVNGSKKYGAWSKVKKVKIKK